MRIRNVLKEEKGSSSIFIVIILLCLLTFGVLSLMSSYSDLKLARKAETWVTTYYQLDNEGSIFMSRVDNCLQTARVNYNDFRATGIIPAGSDEAQDHISAYISGLGANGSPDRLYMLFALQALKASGYQTIPETPEQLMAVNVLDYNSMIVKKNFSAVSGNATQNLTVAIGMIPWSQQQTKRYQVIEWKQWQDQIQVPEESMVIWQGD